MARFGRPDKVRQLPDGRLPETASSADDARNFEVPSDRSDSTKESILSLACCNLAGDTDNSGMYLSRCVVQGNDIPGYRHRFRAVPTRPGRPAIFPRLSKKFRQSEFNVARWA
jgi:hypothetical protein